MAELSSGAVVRVVNPSAVVQVSAPGLVQGLWLKEGPAGPAGRSVTTVARTSGTGAPGTLDTYTITYSDATTSTFTVYNGSNGTGTGDVVGPAGAVNNRIPVFDGTTGKLIKDSGVSLSEKQDFDTDLAGIAALVSAADKMPYATGPGTWSLADLTAFARTLLDDADAATARATLGTAANVLGGDEVSAAFNALTGTVTINAATASIHYNATDLTGNITLALSNLSQSGKGRLVTVYVKHNTTLRTVAFSGATLEWQTAIPTGTANKRTTYHFQGLGDGASTVLAWGTVGS